MASVISLNPIGTNNAAGTFGTSWTGGVAGTFLDDPAIRNELAGGFVASTETLPMWGGLGISEGIPGVSGTSDVTLGGPISRAVSVATPSGSQQAVGPLTGFTVFNQAHNMVSTPQSPVPLAAALMGVNFFRLGSGARLWVPCSSGLVNSEGKLISSQFSWDFTAQELVPYNAAWNANTITGATYSSVANTVTFTTGSGHGIAVGSVFDINSVVSTGATGGGTYNGTFTAITGTVSSTLVATYNPPNAGNPGTYSSGGIVPAGGGALAAKVLSVEIGNSMVPVYNTTTGFATWNYSGNTAMILI